MAKSEEIFKVEGFVLRQTTKAVQVRIHGEDLWIPRSQLFDDEELPGEGHAEIKMTAWIAKEKGLR